MIKLKDMIKTPAGSIVIMRYDDKDYGVEVGGTIKFNPATAWKNSQSYSTREKQASNLPRLFFYTEGSKIEPMFRQRKEGIYATTVKRRDILDITKELQNQRGQNYAFDKKTGQMSFQKAITADDILRDAKKTHQGVMYRLPNGMEVVAIFYPIECKRIA